jgi:hypothetical protein
MVYERGSRIGPRIGVAGTAALDHEMESAMTCRLWRRPTSKGWLATAVVATALAAAPIASASAQTASRPDHGFWTDLFGGDAGQSGAEADSFCGTFLAQPPYANGQTIAACQGFVPGQANVPSGRFINQGRF